MLLCAGSSGLAAQHTYVYTCWDAWRKKWVSVSITSKPITDTLNVSGHDH